MRVLIAGAGGYSKEVFDLVRACDHVVTAFLDDYRTGSHEPTGLPVLGEFDPEHFDLITCAVGDCKARKALYARHSQLLPFAAFVHPSACVSSYATVGEGTQVFQNVVVNADATVAENVILNVGCVVAHDCRVGAHSHIAPGALLSGNSSVGEATMVGAAAVLIPGVRVGARCVIGAGAVVTRDVPDGVTAVGVPARVLGVTRDAE